MRVAIPAFEGEVSPRFCFAPEVVVLEAEGGREVGRARLPLRELCCADRLRLLAGQGVTLLVCGGFNSAFLPDAERAGIHVVWGVTGPLDQAVHDVLAGKLVSPRDHPHCWCRERGSRPRTPSHPSCPRRKRRAARS